MEQLACTFRHHIGEGWMGSSYHLSMPTWSTTISQTSAVAILRPS
jgi:hypothetical protein